MVKRRRISRRSTRRVRRKRVSRGRMRGMRGSKTYYFKRFVYKLNLNGNDVTPAQFGSPIFTVNDVTGVNDFINLFDRYRIMGIAYRWVCRKDPSTNSATAVANQGKYPSIHWVYDWDDNTPFTNLGDMQQYPSYKEFYFSPDKPVTKWKYFKPSTLNVGYETAVLSTYTPTWKGFIDMASANAPFYGLKFATQEHFAGIMITLECKYYMAFKNPR